MSAEPLPEWFFPPPGGWTADDLDRLPPQAPRHLELIDGALIVRSPQTRFHMRVINRLVRLLEDAAPDGVEVAREMTVTLGLRQRLEPDVLVVRPPGADDLTLTTYQPEDVLLVVEVESGDSEVRDRTTKPQRYAEAGIPHFWRVGNEDGLPVVHVYELDEMTRSYVPTAILREPGSVPAPFRVDIAPHELVH